MANPFFVEPANPLKALLIGGEAFGQARKRSAEDELRSARTEAGQIFAQGGDTRGALGRLIGLGDADTIKALSTVGKTDLTDEIKEYQLARSQGEKRSFTEWKASLKRAGATNVNVNSGEKSYDQALGKDYADIFVGTQKGGRNATKTIGTLDLMENLTRNPNFYSGFGGDVALKANQALVGLGVKDPKATSAGETFRALGNQAILDATGGSLGNQISNADREFLMNTAPNLATTPEGNRELIGIRRKLAQREMDVAKLAREYAGRNSGRLDAGFDNALSQWVEQNPLFPRSTGGAPQQVPAQGGLPRPQSKAERDALPPGTKYLAPDGSERTRQ